MVDKEMVHLLCTQSVAELIRGCDTGGKNHRLRFLQHQIHRLKGARSLLGEDDTEIPGVLHRVRDPVAVQLPDGKAGGADGDRNKKGTTEGKAPAGSKTAVGVVALHYRRLSLRVGMANALEFSTTVPSLRATDYKPTR